MLIQPSFTNLHPPSSHSEVKFKQICHFPGQGHYFESLKNLHISSFLFSLCNLNMIALSFVCTSVVIWHQTPYCFNIVYRCVILLWGILAIIINKEDPGSLMEKQGDDSPHGNSVGFLYLYKIHICKMCITNVLE